MRYVFRTTEVRHIMSEQGRWPCLGRECLVCTGPGANERIKLALRSAAAMWQQALEG